MTFHGNFSLRWSLGVHDELVSDIPLFIFMLRKSSATGSVKSVVHFPVGFRSFHDPVMGRNEHVLEKWALDPCKRLYQGYNFLYSILDFITTQARSVEILCKRGRILQRWFSLQWPRPLKIGQRVTPLLFFLLISEVFINKYTLSITNIATQGPWYKVGLTGKIRSMCSNYLTILSTLALRRCHISLANCPPATPGNGLQSITHQFESYMRSMM